MGDIRNLDDLAEYAYQQIERIQQMQQDLEAQVGHGRSPRGGVTATTGPGGVVRELHIKPAALRLPVEEVEAEVIAAISAAQQQYAERAGDIMEPVLSIRPSEQSELELARGVSELDGIMDDLNRIARRHGLD